MLTHEAACTSGQVSVHCQGLMSTLHVKHIKPPKARQELLQCQRRRAHGSAICL